jgi:hypothetical protein
MQMSAVLLTGAGFSHNWGGRLAREMNTAVARLLQNDRDLADLLQRNPNFEEALAEVQGGLAERERLQKLEAAIVDAFTEMNSHLASAEFNFCPEIQFKITEFLVLFDAIFTLNQDLLLEAQYLNPGRHNFSLAHSRQWLGGVLPATEVIPSSDGSGPFDPLTVQRRPKPSPADKIIEHGYQPYFKLHGSTNWQDPSGQRLLVMGGNKPTTMQRHPILEWYASKFAEYLSKPEARLMVIGYGFRDHHINKIIEDAWEKGGRTLSMFIVHPDGRDILRKVNPTCDRPVYKPEPLEYIRVLDSTRPLGTTFGGNDPGEHKYLITYARGLP